MSNTKEEIGWDSVQEVIAVFFFLKEWRKVSKPLGFISDLCWGLYTQPSISSGSTSMGSINLKSKIFKKKKSRNSKRQNLNFLYAGNYLCNIYIEFGITSNLKMINTWEAINRLYEITSFNLRDLSIHGFWYPWQGVGS